AIVLLAGRRPARVVIRPAHGNDAMAADAVVHDPKPDRDPLVDRGEARQLQSCGVPAGSALAARLVRHQEVKGSAGDGGVRGNGAVVDTRPVGPVVRAPVARQATGVELVIDHGDPSIGRRWGWSWDRRWGWRRARGCLRGRSRTRRWRKSRCWA